MNHKEEDIIKYISGHMTSEEIERFQLVLKTDVELQQIVSDYEMMQRHIDSKADIDRALSNLKSIHEESVKTTNTLIDSTIKKWIWIGILLILGILIGSYLMTTAGQSTETELSEDLFASYFDPDEASFLTKGQDSNELLMQAQILFNSKNYTESIIKFEKLREINEYDIAVDFYYGCTLLGAGQTKESRDILNSLIDSQSIYKNEAKWYIALSYLQDKNPSSARSMLREIEKTSSKYTKAQKLLSQLDSSPK